MLEKKKLKLKEELEDDGRLSLLLTWRNFFF
jgi:hypothetical protein